MNLVHKLYLLKTANIFRALAFESSLFDCPSVRGTDYLLFWISSPCVVVGRHQTILSEVNLNQLRNMKSVVARRSSGGGAVYHDEGNLNVSFVSGRERCDRKANMVLIKEALNNKWNIDCEVGRRDELLVKGNLKVSGSSSRLARYSAFHHCTLLLNSNLNNQSSLKPSLNIESNATNSVRSPVTNLNLDIPSVIEEISGEYCRSRGCKIAHIIEVKHGEEDKFVDAHIFKKYLSQFFSYDWIFKKSPPFKIKKSFLFEEESINIEIICKKYEIESIEVIGCELYNGNALKILRDCFVGSELIKEGILKKCIQCRNHIETFDNDRPLLVTKMILGVIEDIAKDL